MTDSKKVIRDYQSVVSARGTTEGLVLRLDGRREERVIEDAIREFMAIRKTFLEGQRVTIEWLGHEASAELAEHFSGVLEEEYGLLVDTVRFRQAASKQFTRDDEIGLARRERAAASVSTPPTASKDVSKIRELGSLVKVTGPRKVNLEVITPKRKEESQSLTLFDGVDEVFSRSGSAGSPAASEELGASSMNKVSSASIGNAFPEELVADDEQSRADVVTNSDLWDDPDARVIFATLRSGQRIDTEHTLVIFGDVNSGAELVAGGDIIVLGALRGVAHAGAFDESGGGRVIVALQLEPTQLRIGTVITRGLGEGLSKFFGRRRVAKGPEIARVDGDTIVVEPYRARQTHTRGGPRENLG